MVNQCAVNLESQLNDMDSSKDFEFLVEIEEKQSIDQSSARFDYDKENQSENVISLRSPKRPTYPFEYQEKANDSFKNPSGSYTFEEQEPESGGALKS
jgi:hypothetical protein